MILEERYVHFICEQKLTQGQFLLLYLMYKNRLDLIALYKETYPADDGTMIGKMWVEDLIKRGFIEQSEKGVKLAVKFKEIFCNKIDVAEELLRVYPSTTEIQGKIVPLTAIDIIEVADLYIEKIIDNRKEHEEVLKDIEYGIIHNMLNISIKKFIQSKYWLAIRKVRKTMTDDTHISKQSNSFG